MKRIRFEGSAGIWGNLGWVRISCFRWLWLHLTDRVARVRWTDEKLPTFNERIEERGK